MRVALSSTVASDLLQAFEAAAIVLCYSPTAVRYPHGARHRAGPTSD
jgi:hypothetical protein